MAIIDKIKAIADAIRSMTGKSEELTLDEMAEEITGIQTAKEPYIEETYDSDGNLIAAKFVGNYTKVRDGLFYKATKMTDCKIPDEVTWIGENSFGICNSIQIDELPPKATYIGNYAFNSCFSLNATKLPENLFHVSRYAFNACKNMTFKKIPSSLATISDNAFRYCPRLTELTFEGTPEVLADTAFDSCTNLLTINVPWAEGEVEGAPWGAVNATINYEFVGGRNLLLDTSNLETTVYVPQFYTILSSRPISELGLVVGDQFTLSVWIKNPEGNPKPVRLRYQTMTNINDRSGGLDNELVYPGETKHVSMTDTMTETLLSRTYFDAMINNGDTSITTTATVQYWGLKLEKGNIATDWSPAPEDSEEE